MQCNATSWVDAVAQCASRSTGNHPPTDVEPIRVQVSGLDDFRGNLRVRVVKQTPLEHAPPPWRPVGMVLDARVPDRGRLQSLACGSCVVQGYASLSLSRSLQGLVTCSLSLFRSKSSSPVVSLPLCRTPFHVFGVWRVSLLGAHGGLAILYPCLK